MTQNSDQHDDQASTSNEPASDMPKLVFAPGCFDNFEGTQEELQELIAEIHRMFNSGEVFENAVPLDEEEAEAILNQGPKARQ